MEKEVKLTQEEELEVFKKLPESEGYKSAMKQLADKLKKNKNKLLAYDNKILSIEHEIKDIEKNYPNNSPQFKEDKRKELNIKLESVKKEKDKYAAESIDKEKNWFKKLSDKLYNDAIKLKLQDKISKLAFETKK